MPTIHSTITNTLQPTMDYARYMHRAYAKKKKDTYGPIVQQSLTIASVLWEFDCADHSVQHACFLSLPTNEHEL